MNDAPEIAPEIRGLLEELVADPRSSIRLAPKRALRDWFDSGETVRAREVSGTKLERHLIEVHREELAGLLFEASRLAFWKAPVLVHRPAHVATGPTAEEAWRDKARRTLELAEVTPEVALLRRCLTTLASESSFGLAQAALCLVANDKARFSLALGIPWNQSRAAIRSLRWLAEHASPSSLRPSALGVLAQRLCSIEMLHEARAVYRESSSKDATPLGWIYAFNLSCFLDDEDAAISDAEILDKRVSAGDPILLEARDILAQWVKTRRPNEVATAKKVAVRPSSIAPQTAGLLACAYQT